MAFIVDGFLNMDDQPIIKNAFSELIEILNSNKELTCQKIEAMCLEANSEIRRNGFALKAASLVKNGSYIEALSLLQKQAASSFKVLPPELFYLIYSLMAYLGQTGDIPQLFFDYGINAIKERHYNLGLEALGTAFVEDAATQLKMAYETEKILKATAAYEQAAGTIPELKYTGGMLWHGSQIKVGMIVANIVDDVVAYSKRIMDFARYIDGTKFKLYVYSTENMCMRYHRLPLRCFSPPSLQVGANYIKQLQERGIPVFFAPIDQPPLQAALLTARKIASDGIHILIIQSGPAMPIDWLACRISPVPVKFHIHIGVPIYQKNIDVVFYDNEANRKREAPYYQTDMGKVMLLRQGTDIDLLLSQQPFDRSQFGIPKDAILIGVLSNHLDTRLTSEYLETIAKVMQKHQKAWFVPIGGKNLPQKVVEFFSKLNLMERVKHITVQRNVGSVLKMLDIYANEFPIGGSQAVVEAMVCGLPVVAMKAKEAHAASSGADFVGAPFAIEEYSQKKYFALLEKWVSNSDERKLAANTMRTKAISQYSIREYIWTVCNIGEELLHKKLKTAFNLDQEPDIPAKPL